MIEHGNLVEAILSTKGAYDFVGNHKRGQSLRTLLISGYSFDIVSAVWHNQAHSQLTPLHQSTWDIYMTLCSGGTLCIQPKTEMLADLPKAIRRMDITLVESSSTVLSTIDCSPMEVPTLTTIGSGAEPMAGAVAKKWAGESSVELVNMYVADYEH